MRISCKKGGIEDNKRLEIWLHGFIITHPRQVLRISQRPEKGPG
jgi:hypothetical protein